MKFLEETQWLLKITTHLPLIHSVVGWVPLIDARVDEHLERLGSSLALKGIRHVLHDEDEDYYMLRDDFNRGIAVLERYGLAYDLLIFERYLPQMIEFVDRCPRQRFVVDHIAKPRVREGQLSPWRNMAELAEREKVFRKNSEIVTEAARTSWTVDNLRYFDCVLSSFRAVRLMFGSDWPVLELAGRYARWTAAFRSLIAELSQEEQKQVSAGTATRVYRLPDNLPEDTCSEGLFSEAPYLEGADSL